jgi:hypothetical protein
MTEKRVSVFPISTTDGAIDYEELANSKKAKVLDEQNHLLKDGTILRVVDYLEADTSKPIRPIYTAPVN